MEPRRFCDCHVHFWTPETHSWLRSLPDNHPVGDMSALREVGFPLSQYLSEAEAGGFSRLLTVHVQGLYDRGDDLEETRWLRSLAEATGHPSAIVAYVDLSLPGSAERLQEHAEAAGGRLKGVRQSLRGPHPERPELHTGPHLLQDERFLQNVGLVAEWGVFELQVRNSDWALAKALAERHGHLQFVINHCGMPFAGERDEWRQGMQLMARCPNVHVKLSGFAIFDNQWSPESLGGVVQALLEEFGADRCMFALDFPIDRLRGSYAKWMHAFRASVDSLDEATKEKLFYLNAVRLYRLEGSK